MTTLRVLQVLADTDVSPRHQAALHLHTVLAGAGVDVRTLALGPGRSGGLATTVPAIAPSRRSLAAHTQLRAEQRWADVVLLQGGAVGEVAAHAGGSARQVLVLWDEPQRWQAGERVPRRVVRSASRAGHVVVGWHDAEAEVVRALHVDPASVSTVPATVEDGPGVVGDAPRAAARTALGLDPAAVVVCCVGDARPAGTTDLGPAAQLGAAVRAGGAVLLDPASAEAELVEAACDVVLVLDGTGGPSLATLRAVRGGAVAVASGRPELADVFEPDVTAVVVPPELAGPDAVTAAVAGLVEGPARRAELARAGSERVRREFSASVLVPRWLDLLAPALPSRR